MWLKTLSGHSLNSDIISILIFQQNLEHSSCFMKKNTVKKWSRLIAPYLLIHLAATPLEVLSLMLLPSFSWWSTWEYTTNSVPETWSPPSFWWWTALELSLFWMVPHQIPRNVMYQWFLSCRLQSNGCSYKGSICPPFILLLVTLMALDIILWRTTYIKNPQSWGQPECGCSIEISAHTEPW